MKEQLKNYIDLLFAAAPEAVDIKQEILQNTLDRYDDLVNQGKTPQAAYQLAISGIGDISEILGSHKEEAPAAADPVPVAKNTKQAKPLWKKLLQAVGIFFYIICPLPLFIEPDETGLCVMLVLIALATALMVFSGGRGKEETQDENNQENSPKSELRKAVHSIIWTVGLCFYFGISFTTQAWYITWVVFPLIGAVQGLVNACMDLKEAGKNET